MTVHMVHYGMVACSMDMPPKVWPEGHKWSGEWRDVTCGACLAAKDYPPTYQILEQGNNLQVGIKCLRCDKVSYNENDVLQGYCGHCHAFHNDIWPPARKRWVEDYRRKHGLPIKGEKHAGA